MYDSIMQYFNGLTNGVYLAIALLMMMYGVSYINKSYNWRIVVAFLLVAFSFFGFGLLNVYIQQSHVTQSFFPSVFFKIATQLAPISIAVLFFIYLRAFDLRSLDAHKLISNFKWVEYLVYTILIATIYYIPFLNSTDQVIRTILFSFIPCTFIMAFIAFWSSGPYIFGHLLGVIFAVVTSTCLFVVLREESLNYQNFFYFNYFLFAFTAVLLGFFIIRFGYKELESFFLVQSLDQYHILHEINHAIRKGELYLEYQPQVNLKTQKMEGAEALLRWQHPKKGLIPPDNFIPLAEQSDMINIISKWVITNVVKDASVFLKQNPDMKFSINFSPKNFNGLIVKHLHSELLKYNVPAKNIIIEITESLMISENDAVVKSAMTLLANIGISLSVDDYGTGFSSLRYLQKQAINELKIDKTFICDLSENKDNHTIVLSTIQMSQNLGLTTVAEGVEDKQTLEILKEMGCDTVQGFIIAKPMSFEELRKIKTNKEQNLT